MAEAESTMQIGGYDETYLKDPSQWLLYLSSSQYSPFWEINIDGFKVGKGSSFGIGQPNGYYLDYYSSAVLDTATNFIYAPIELYHSLMEILLEETDESFYQYGYYWVPCQTEGLESLFLLVASQFFEVPPSSYLIDAGRGYCVIGIQPSPNHEWILGEVFLKNFYVIFDDMNGAVAMAPHKTSKSVAYNTQQLSVPSYHFGPTQMRNRVIKQVLIVAAKIAVAGLVSLSVWFDALVILTATGVIANPAAAIGSLLSY